MHYLIRLPPQIVCAQIIAQQHTSNRTGNYYRICVTFDDVHGEKNTVYIQSLYGVKKQDRIFPITKSYLYHEMERGAKAAGVKRIRIHDLRHSHASLLVEMGFSPLLIAERLGHEHVQTTMDTYSHLYPNKQTEVAQRLDTLMAE